MQAIEIVSHLFARLGLEPDFATELCDHLSTGIVISRPRAFVMCKAVLLEDGRTAWMVAAAAGDLRELITFMPYPLPCIAFRRRGQKRVRVYDLDRFLELANHLIVSHIPSLDLVTSLNLAPSPL